MPRTESGLISITLDSLRDLQDPVARLYFTRGECTALEGGIKQRLPFIGPDGRVHPTHDQLSANTGRISTSEPPMSNLPKVIKGSPLRRGVEAPAGYVLVQGDLGLIEVRAQAHFTGDPTDDRAVQSSAGTIRAAISTVCSPPGSIWRATVTIGDQRQL